MKKIFIALCLIFGMCFSACAYATQSRFESLSSDKLIIFLTGWGCDDNQFANLIKNNKNYDLFIAWNYTDLDFIPDIDYSKYKEIYLITYSAGVYVAGLVQGKFPPITKSIAINGNPYMFDAHYGISPETLAVFKNLNASNADQFRKDYLIKYEKELKYLNKNSDKRTLESCLDELESLEAFSKSEFKPYDFDRAILSDSDKIFNPETQKEYFNGRYILLKNTAHNPFYHLRTFDKIIKIAR